MDRVVSVIERDWPRCEMCGKPADIQEVGGRNICVECMIDEIAPAPQDHDRTARRIVEGENDENV
jgi:hypothetical protein